MINGKKKGKNGELEVVRYFRACGFPDARRSAQYCGNNADGSADVVGVPLLHLEVKRVERLNINDALQQAVRDADKQKRKEMPVVVHRTNNTDWKVTMRIDDFINLYRTWAEEMGAFTKCKV